MRVLCIGYRAWALNIYDRLSKDGGHIFLVLRDRDQYAEDLVHDFKPDLILFYGWSWMIPKEIFQRYTCLMLHPSPLPRYRGGSPLQNQIIRGETESMVTIFVINDEVDGGDIIGQEKFSLLGGLDVIFERIEDLGYLISKRILSGHMVRLPQDRTKKTEFLRRSPEESEISHDELCNKDALYLYNKIRMLADPYPNAFIRTADGKKLYIKWAEIE